jgi:hypothetical protein
MILFPNLSRLYTCLLFSFGVMSMKNIGRSAFQREVHVYKLAQKSVSVYGGVAYLDSSGVSLYFLGNFISTADLSLFCRGKSQPGYCSLPSSFLCHTIPGCENLIFSVL